MKVFILIVLFMLGGVFYTLKDSTLYWLPSGLRAYLYPSRFAPGDCIISKEKWAVNPKQIIGLKFKGKKTYYLLRDQDRHEHDQIIFLSIVDQKAQKVNCKR